MENFIVPLRSITESSDSFWGNAQRANTAAIPFADIFRATLAEADINDEITKEAGIATAIGDVDRLHELTIASTKADMALKLFVQLRNKAQDTYSEVMRMGV